jgi:hypothetical protein
MVIALIALFVALGGTSYAAINALPKNSVGTKQLKNGAVTAKKINSSAAGKVMVVGLSQGAPAYAAGWEAGTGGGDEAASFYKDAMGIVHLQGNAETTGGPATGKIFTLPAGYRPQGNIYFEVYGNSGVPGQIQIQSDGDVYEFSVAKSYVGLSNISFRAGV